MGFLVPSTRTIAATLWLASQSPDGNELLVDLVPTGSGDPLIATAPESLAPEDVWLSKRVSEKLGLKAGMQVTAYVQRKTERGEESEEIVNKNSRKEICSPAFQKTKINSKGAVHQNEYIGRPKHSISEGIKKHAIASNRLPFKYVGARAITTKTKIQKAQASTVLTQG
jgi:hypothetical protein